MYTVEEVGISNNSSIPFKSNEHCLEDGPLFRATVQQLENRTLTLKLSLKRIIKASNALLEAKKSLKQANEDYTEALQNACFTEPLMSHYLNSATIIIRKQQLQLEQMLESKLIKTLKNIYQNEIKIAEIKRRQFEETSKDYYSALAKYLKSSKKKDHSPHSQKAKYDLDRFDYLTFLMDLHGGKREYEILFAITDYARHDYHFYEETADQLINEMKGLDGLTKILQTSWREQKALNQEREVKRNELLAKIESHCIDPLENRSKFNVFKDTDLCETVGRKKEGFLFAPAKPVRNSSTFDRGASVQWHKYWCVLSEGQLHEYSNWKRQLEPHIEPISLRFATVRRVNNIDRRFCFEISTPYIRRIYQGTSSEETANWVATIQNAIKYLLNETHSSILLSRTSLKSGHGRSLSDAFKFGLNSMTLNHKFTKRHSNTPAELLVSASTSMERFRWSGFNFGHGGCSKGPYGGHYLFPVFSNANEKLELELKEDPSNNYCADCGAYNPDWCSLNLGILLCIECSGMHRSLGTHISKIRSINLDSSSYTPDIIGVLRSVGNEKSNKIWDPQVDENRPNETESRSTKLKYIKDKYAERLFVKKKESPTKLLFEAIDRDDILDALNAIALGANPNVSRPEDGSARIPLFSSIYSPAIADLEDVTNKTKADTQNENFTVRYALHYALLHGRVTDNQTTIFPMAEFLLQNGADTSIIDPQTDLSLSKLISLGSVIGDDGIAYINMKNRARGQALITRTVLSSSASIASLVLTETQ